MKFYMLVKVVVYYSCISIYFIWSLKSVIILNGIFNFDSIIWFDKYKLKLVFKYQILTIIFYFHNKINLLIVKI